jgi:hypothetical protein
MDQTIKLKQEIEFEIQPVKFHWFEAARHLDLNYYANVPTTTLEIGYYGTDCCRRMLTAVVEKGMITKLELEPCKNDNEELAAELAKKLNVEEIREKLPKPVELSLPMPLARFNEDLAIEWWTCFRICGFGYCIFCCFGYTHGSFVFCSVEHTLAS